MDPQVAFGQYSLKTWLLPALLSPLTVMFQPVALPVASIPEKLFIWAVRVCACPLRVSAEKFGTSGEVPNDRLPAVTENWVVSVTAEADGAAKRRAAAAAINTHGYLLLNFT